MLPKPKGRSTPAELDFAFERELINEQTYAEFWPAWWGATETGKKKIIKDLLDRDRGGYIVKPPKVLSGPITRSKTSARSHAKRIGGYVARRNSRGQFSKRGTYYQALAPRKQTGRKKEKKIK